jgi:small subunit ribosomal protein S7
MSRRRRVIHKEVKKDARYASPLVASLISSVMQSGKKSIAEKIVYTAIDKTREGTDTVDPAALVVPHTKCRWKFQPVAKSPWLCAGS